MTGQGYVIGLSLSVAGKPLLGVMGLLAGTLGLLGTLFVNTHRKVFAQHWQLILLIIAPIGVHSCLARQSECCLAVMYIYIYTICGNA